MLSLFRNAAGIRAIFSLQAAPVVAEVEKKIERPVFTAQLKEYAYPYDVDVLALT